MKYLVLLLVGAFVFALPQSANAAQCTTGALDLMCPSGQVLEGISSNGSKRCVPLPTQTFIASNCPSGQFAKGINSYGRVVCSNLPLVNNPGTPPPRTGNNVRTVSVSAPLKPASGIGGEFNCVSKPSSSASCYATNSPSAAKCHANGAWFTASRGKLCAEYVYTNSRMYTNTCTFECRF